MGETGNKLKAALCFSFLLSLICANTATAITEQLVAPYGTFVGIGAGASNQSSGEYNAFFGYMAGNSNSSGSHNTFVGASSGYKNSTAYFNTFVGRSSGYENTTGEYNTFVGWGAGRSNTVGNSNTYIGGGAGVNAQGSGNVFIGKHAGWNETGSNRLHISNSELNSPLIYGEFDSRLVEINGSLVFASDERLKKNIEPLKSSLDKIMKLNGIYYEWIDANDRGAGKNIGLVAQNVESIVPEVVRTDGKGYKALSYDRLVPLLIEAIKEQQATIEEQKTAIKQLSERLSKFEKFGANP